VTARPIETSYLYQLYAYLASQSGFGDDAADNADGVLLFVKTSDREVFTAEKLIQGHRIRFLSVDLTATAADVRARWLECIQHRITRSQE
jgi:5-methylcytosine-specific restriction enzyme subunit McrC